MMMDGHDNFTLKSYFGDEAIVHESKLWRDGPASLIYDQLGIPEDCDRIDYSLVLQPREESWESLQSQEENDRLLEEAVQSILPPSDNEQTLLKDRFPASGDNFQPLPYRQCGLNQGKPNGCRLPSAQFRGVPGYKSPATGQPVILNANLNDPDENPRLKIISSQQEQAEAVSALLQEMNRVQEEEFACDLQNSEVMEDECTLSFPDKQNCESYSLVTQIQWENDIIWDSESHKTALADLKNAPVPREKQTRAGWVPSHTNRTAYSMADLAKDGSFKSFLSYENEELVQGSWEDEVIWNANDFRCQFPQPKLPVFDATDEEMVFEMPKDVPIPNQSQAIEQQQQLVGTPRKHIVQPHTMKSKLILGKTGFIHWKWKKEQLEQQAREAQEKISRENEKKALKKKDSWTSNLNISNDEFYQSKESAPVAFYNCRHSKLVKDLNAPFILTHLDIDQLRDFHRPKLSATVNAPLLSEPGQEKHYFKSLVGRMDQKLKERRRLSAQGHPILLDQPIDLSARDGDIILIENCEEYPPLLSQVGMCSQIINFIKRKSLKDDKDGPPQDHHKFGETSYVSSASSFPFLGTLENGQVLSSICNNMYCSPIYWQGTQNTDFLVIRSKRSGYLIRDINGLFVAGQQCPFIEVPEPNSSKLKNFLRDFLQVFVYRKYLADKHTSRSNAFPARVRMDLITQNFPTLPESTIRSALKHSSELKKIGNVTWMVMKTEFTLPREEELAEMVTPEQVCAYYSLLATEQRLKDAGLDSMLALPERRQDDLVGNKGRKSLKGGNANSLLSTAGASELKVKPTQQQQQPSQSAFDEEILSAPWNTTSAFVAASKGKCLLQITGPADPTGCGEGFSYVRVAKRGTGVGGEQHQHSGRGRPRKYPPKTGGTDADLRKLSTKTAKDLLRKVGVPEKEIQKLSRWEIIDLVRTLSTEKMMQGETLDRAITKFSRWKSIHSTAMNQERYQEICQKIFELQNKALSSRAQLSSDEEESDEDASHSGVDGTRRAGASRKEIEQMGKKIECILYGDSEVNRMTHEEEELERLELQKMMLGGIMEKDAEIAKRKETLEREKELAQKSKENSEDILNDLMKHSGRVLKISRTFKQKGEFFVRTEIVRDPLVIAAYLRIRNSKSEEFIKQFLQKAERLEKKEQKQKERLLLGRLKDVAICVERKVEKMQIKRKREIEDEYFPNKEAKKDAEKAMRSQKRKCGTCGLPGHMRTSKDCPMFSEEKIVQIMKKREAKKKRVKKVADGTTMMSISESPSASQEKENEGPSSNSDSSDDDSSDSSSDDSSASSDSDDSFDDTCKLTQSTASSQEEQPIVKTDGLKMFVKRSSIQEMITQAQEQEAKEQEVARILAAMSAETLQGNNATNRRKVPQAERENADYLQDRKYKTTAADRRSAKW